jgi:hypothetical protein
MKLALILFGMSYKETHMWGTAPPIKVSIDYKMSYDNYKIYIYEHFTSLGYDIDVYFTTNEMDDKHKEEIINIYNPINYDFISDCSNIITSRNTKLINSLKLCMNSNIEYDICLVTRFDLLFQQKIPIDLDLNNLFYLISTLEKPHYICDNFYLFPYKYLNDFYKIANKNINIMFHFIKNDFLQICDIHYIKDEKCKISGLTFYKINRIYI